jgi:RimJ/RimL family protein N-acetyltransferase
MGRVPSLNLFIAIRRDRTKARDLTVSPRGRAFPADTIPASRRSRWSVAQRLVQGTHNPFGGTGVNHSDHQNRLGCIGYWVRTSATGRGIAVQHGWANDAALYSLIGSDPAAAQVS